MKKNESLPDFFERLMAGIIAPSKFPRCGRPLLCIPVKIRVIDGKYNRELPDW